MGDFFGLNGLNLPTSGMPSLVDMKLRLFLPEPWDISKNIGSPAKCLLRKTSIEYTDITKNSRILNLALTLHRFRFVKEGELAAKTLCC